MKATITLTNQEASRRIKSQTDGQLPAVPTLYFLEQVLQFFIEGKAHGHGCSDFGYPLVFVGSTASGSFRKCPPQRKHEILNKEPVKLTVVRLVHRQ